MKKLVCYMLALAAIAAMSGCGEKPHRKTEADSPAREPIAAPESGVGLKDGDVLWYSADGWTVCVWSNGEPVMVERAPIVDHAWDLGQAGWVYDGSVGYPGSVG